MCRPGLSTTRRAPPSSLWRRLPRGAGAGPKKHLRARFDWAKILNARHRRAATNSALPLPPGRGCTCRHGGCRRPGITAGRARGLKGPPAPGTHEGCHRATAAKWNVDQRFGPLEKNGWRRPAPSSMGAAKKRKLSLLRRNFLPFLGSSHPMGGTLNPHF